MPYIWRRREDLTFVQQNMVACIEEQMAERAKPDGDVSSYILYEFNTRQLEKIHEFVQSFFEPDAEEEQPGQGEPLNPYTDEDLAQDQAADARQDDPKWMGD